MLFEQYPFQDPLTLSINDGGINELNFDLTLFDFTSLNDINIYLSPTQSKPTEYDLSNDSINNDSQCQEEFCPDFDFIDFDRFDEKSGKTSLKRRNCLQIHKLTFFFKQIQYQLTI